MKPLIVANWKMNPQTLAGAKKLFNSIKKGLKNIKNACPVGSRKLSFGVEVVICPPFVWLPQLKTTNYKLLKLGAQNCFWEKKGAFTGEISPLMLKNLGCQYVILGHSEREKYFQETDEMTNKKIKAAISAKLRPILCIGETEKEKREGKTPQVLKNQLEKTLINLSTYQLINLIIAYEPIWAIGTGRPCHPEEAKVGVLTIRKALSNLYNPALSQKIKILYGGSVNSKIAKDYIKEANFKGLLIGGASLRAKEFIEILKRVS